MLTGQNGILNRASEAKDKTGISQEEESVKLSISDALTQGLGTIMTEDLQTALTNNGLKGTLTGNGPWTYTGEYKKYKIEKNGSMTSSDNTSGSSGEIVEMVGSYGITESKKLIKMNITQDRNVWKEATIGEEVSEVGTVKEAYSGPCGKHFIINDEGDVYSWGYNYSGQLGIGNDIIDQSSPIKMNGISNVEEIYTFGENYSYARTMEGYIYAWGNNYSGQLGIGNTQHQNTPVKINELSNIVKMQYNGSTNFMNLYAITKEGEIYAWGENSHGILGIGNTEAQNKPVKLNGINNVEKIYFGDGCAYAKTKSGEVYAWGENGNGQLGVGNTEQQNIPVKIEDLPSVDEIYLNDDITGGYFKTKTGEIYLCGDVYGWSEKENEEDYYKPSKFEKVNGVEKIQMNGCDETYVLTKDRSVYKMYYYEDENGENGRDTIEKMDILNNTEKIYTLNGSMFAKKTNGEIYAWGRNEDGLLGIGSESEWQEEPIKMNNLSNVEELYIFERNYAYAKTSTGKVYSWGRDYGGRLGFGDNIDTINVATCWDDIQELKEKNVKVKSLQMNNDFPYDNINILTEDGRIFVYRWSSAA